MKKVGDGVSKAFESVRIYAAPHPGNAVSKASEKDKSLTFASKFILALLLYSLCSIMATMCQKNVASCLDKLDY